jgi:hypothetical protein
VIITMSHPLSRFGLGLTAAKSRYSRRAKKRSALPMPTFATGTRTPRRSTMAFRGLSITNGGLTPIVLPTELGVPLGSDCMQAITTLGNVYSRNR